MASFTGLKNIGEDVLEYMMKHRPWPDEEMSAGLHDLDNVFPGIYGRHASDYKTFADDPRIDAQSLKVINAVRGNPEAMVDIYRAVPKGVRDFNTGDWISISKNYAKQHGESVLNGDYDLIKAKARAADISEPGDSIAEQGYWGSPIIGKVTRGILPLFAAGGAGAAAALAPGEAQAADPEGTWRDTASARLDEFKRGLGLGTRNVMEGLGDVADTFLNQPINAVGRLFGYDPGLVNPGKGIADAMGLPVPETDLEKNMALWESGAASAVPLIMSGGAMAKMAASPVARGVGRALSSTPKTDIVAGGLLNRFLGGD